MLQKIKLFSLNVFSKIRIKILGKYAVSITYNTENGLISMPIEDFTIGRKLGFQGKWDWNEIKNLMHIINVEDTIYIIGTHVGTLFIPLAKKAKKVVGFEANPTTFNYLQNNLFLNNVKNYNIYNYAVGNKYGDIEFLQSKVNSGGSKILPNTNDYSFRYDNPSIIKVDMILLDDFIEKNNLPFGEILIIDIEGSEFIALQGMKKSLEKCRYLYIEYEPNHLKYVSNCNTDDFFNLFIHDFVKVTFMRKGITINLKDNLSDFTNLVTEMYKSNISDDLLLSK